VKRDFLQLSDLSPDEHRTLFGRARELKSMRRAGQPVRTLEGRSLLLLFEKASTRTRISFEAAIGQLGGNATRGVGEVAEVTPATLRRRRSA